MPQPLRLRLAKLDRMAEDRLLEIGEPEVREFFDGSERAKHDERSAFEAGRQHRRDTIEERGQVVVAEPAGQLDVCRREQGLDVDDVGDVAGLRNGSSLAHLNNDALERARAKGDVHRLTKPNRKAVGDAIGECLAERSGGVDRYFGERHCGASIASEAVTSNDEMSVERPFPLILGYRRIEWGQPRM